LGFGHSVNIEYKKFDYTLGKKEKMRKMLIKILLFYKISEMFLPIDL
jgi:hypothetical protein